MAKGICPALRDEGRKAEPSGSERVIGTGRPSVNGIIMLVSFKMPAPAITLVVPVALLFPNRSWQNSIRLKLLPLTRGHYVAWFTIFQNILEFYQKPHKCWEYGRNLSIISLKHPEEKAANSTSGRSLENNELKLTTKPAILKASGGLLSFMISNERPSPFGRRPYEQMRPPVNEDTLKSERLQVERKMFFFTLKENPRGRFLRITEDVGGHHNTIIIPSTGLKEFLQVFQEMMKTSDEIKPKADSP
jgi:hypothetical protein